MSTFSKFGLSIYQPLWRIAPHTILKCQKKHFEIWPLRLGWDQSRGQTSCRGLDPIPCKISGCHFKNAKLMVLFRNVTDNANGLGEDIYIETVTNLGTDSLKNHDKLG